MFYMDNRKVIKFGKTSFVVSLPIKWLRKCNLDKGDLLDVKEKHSCLMISPTYKDDCTREHTILLNKDTNFLTLMNRVKSAYLSNNDMIKIQGDVKPHIDNIHKTVNGFNALEIVDISDDEVVLKDYVDKGFSNPNDIFLRINSIITTMFQYLIKNNGSDDIIKLDLQVNKLNNFINKLVHHNIDNFKDNTEKLMILAKMSNYLELIGDEIKRIAKLDKDNRVDRLVIKDVFDNYKENFLLAIKLLTKSASDISYMIEKKDYMLKNLDRFYDITDSKVVAASSQRLKNIVEFSHIILMSAHVYALM